MDLDSKVEVIRDFRSYVGKAAQGGLGARAAGSLNRLIWMVGEPRRRRYALDAYGPRTHTVSVGNIAFGGAGKTPIVIGLARDYLSRGKSVAVVLKHSRRRPGREEPETSPMLNKYGDEEVLIKYEALVRWADRAGDGGNGLAVFAGADKVRVIRELDGGDWEVIIVDDGFQLTGLIPEASIAIISPGDIGLGELDSALREPPGSLVRASHVLVNSSLVPPVDEKRVLDAVNDRLTAIGAVRALASFRYEPQTLVPLSEVASSVIVAANRHTRKGESPAVLTGKTVLSFSGIARPQGFERTLVEAGCGSVYSVRFPDHHFFTSRDLSLINRLASERGADLTVTSMKDACRLGLIASSGALPGSSEARALIEKTLALRIAPVFSTRGDEKTSSLASILDVGIQ